MTHAWNGEKCLQSTGLIETAWFLTTTSPLPAFGIGASLTCKGLPFGSVIHAALFDMVILSNVTACRCQIVYGVLAAEIICSLCVIVGLRFKKPATYDMVARSAYRGEVVDPETMPVVWIIDHSFAMTSLSHQNGGTAWIISVRPVPRWQMFVITSTSNCIEVIYSMSV
jgi:hypothetical protein